MSKTLVSMALALCVIAAPVLAGETTVTLAVRNWYYAACPRVIKQSLAAVPGVINVAVSDKKKTASVIFDDTKTNVKALTEAISLLPLYGRHAVAMKDPALITSDCHYITSDNHAAYRY